MKKTRKEYKYPLKWKIFSGIALVLVCMLLYMDLSHDYGLSDRIGDFFYYGIRGISYEIRTPDFPHYETECQQIPEGFWEENQPCPWWKAAESWSDADWQQAFPGLSEAQMESLQDLPRGKGEAMSYWSGLKLLGFDVPVKEAKQILEMADFDYSVMALRTAAAILEEENLSAKRLREKLGESGYTPKEITYALEHCGADWNFQAVQCLKNTLMHSNASRAGLLRTMTDYERFTEEEAAYAMGQIEIDYVRHAQRVSVWLRHKGWSREEIMSELRKDGFQEEEVLKGVSYRWWKFWDS